MKKIISLILCLSIFSIQAATIPTLDLMNYEKIMQLEEGMDTSLLKNDIELIESMRIDWCRVGCKVWYLACTLGCSNDISCEEGCLFSAEACEILCG